MKKGNRMLISVFRRITFLFIGAVLLVSPTLQAQEAPRHVDVYHEAGRFAAWPANQGLWHWGDEILVGFIQAYLGDPETEKGHLMDPDRPRNAAFARSLDGGETWKTTPANLPTGAAKPFPTDLPLTATDFILALRGESAFSSVDRGHTWAGPWKLPFGESMTLQARTDYQVMGEKDLMLFLSAVKPDGNEGRPFSTRTRDGGKTWNQFAWIGANPETRFSIMPSSVRLESGRFLVSIRRREDVPAYNTNFIELFKSDNGGLSWELLAVPAKDTGNYNGNPPSMLQLANGRLCITTGYREEPFHMFAVLSDDEGKTWSAPRVLRANGGGWDMGYSRSLQRTDGKIVTIYYFHDQPHSERYIAATIWSAE
jgi:hypothetical protein